MTMLVAISIVSYIQLWTIGEPTGRLEVKPMNVQVFVFSPRVHGLTYLQCQGDFAAL